MQETAASFSAKKQFLPLENAHQEFSRTDECEQILQSCFGSAVSAFGEWCVVELCAPHLILREPWIFHQEAMVLSQQDRQALSTINHLWQEIRAVHSSCHEGSFLSHLARDAEHLKSLQQLNITSYISAPLCSDQHIWGWLTIFSTEHSTPILSSDIAKIQALASCAATALDLGILRHQASQMYEFKNRFVAMISHELRAPLNITLGWSAILLDNPDLDDETRRTIEIIYRNTREQADIISNLLDTTRIDLGKLTLDLKEIHVSSFVEQHLQGLSILAREKGVTLRSEVQTQFAQLVADPVRLHQILQNLVVNAIKFTPKGGVITVKLEEDPQYVILKVIDTGDGISKDFLPFVFDKFKQRLGKSTYQPGLGLGLSIVRDLVEAHGGDVSAESEGPRCGATFTVRLPKKIESQLSSSSPLELVH